jgi:hypothetical protein
MKQAHHTSSMSKVRSDVILIIRIESLVAFSILNQNYILKVRIHFSFSILLLSILAAIFAIAGYLFEMRLIV